MASDINMQVVGNYTDRFNVLTGQNLPCGKIYQSSGLRVHVQSRHPNAVQFLPLIPDIICNPDYVGKHPSEPNSIELVKQYANNLMLCIKLDTQRGYFYVSTLFEISQYKLQSRIQSGRLKSY